jgi:hypothetical protein
MNLKDVKEFSLHFFSFLMPFETLGVAMRD